MIDLSKNTVILFHSWEYLYIFIWHVFHHHQQQQNIGEGVRKAVELDLCFCVSLFFNLFFENFLHSPPHFDYSHSSPLISPTSMPLLYPPNLASFFYFNVSSPIYTFIYSWVCDLPLEHGLPNRGHTFKGNWVFLSQQLSIVSRIEPLYTVVKNIN